MNTTVRSIITPAAAGAALQCPPTANPLLISFLLNNTMTDPKPAPVAVDPKQLYQEQQRAYVNALVDVTIQAIASIWPNATNTPQSGNRPIANLGTFLHHILKHSRTTHSTLQLAIFYLFRIRPRVLERRNNDMYIACGRRMFLAALICAHKFLQDKTYKNSAWSKVSGLSVTEVNQAERVMLQLLDWSLYVKKETYDYWLQTLQTHLKVLPPTMERKPEIEHQKAEQYLPKQHTLPTPIATIYPTNVRSAVTSDTNLDTVAKPVPMATVKATTTVHFGMPTPVEEHKSSIQACTEFSGLLSPPERKRKRSVDEELFSIKKRV